MPMPVPTPTDLPPLDTLATWVDRFAEARIVVWGDVVADRFLYGSTTRISREAPALVVRRESEEIRPGGAGNAMMNAAALGANGLRDGAGLREIARRQRDVRALLGQCARRLGAQTARGAGHEDPPAIDEGLHGDPVEHRLGPAEQILEIGGRIVSPQHILLSADGDRVTVDFEGRLDGEVFEGGTGEDVPFELGQGQMIEDFDQGVRGLAEGDTGESFE